MEHAIFGAVLENDIMLVRQSIARDSECLNARNKFKETPLIAACTSSHNDVIVELLKQPHIDINASCFLGCTALWCAAKLNQQPFIIDMLLERGANINAENDEGITPLTISANFDNRAITEVLVKRGAEIDRVSREGHSLYRAIEKRYSSIDIDYVLKYGNFSNEKLRKRFLGLRLNTIFR